MNLIFTDSAKKELLALPPNLKSVFLKHFEKIQNTPPRRHMKYGIPCHVEEVTKQARIIYNIENEDAYILHCFKNHKEYERWYTQYR